MFKDYQPPQFNLRFLLLAVTLAAIWSAGFIWLSVGSSVVLAVILLTFLFGCWRTRRAVLIIFTAIYWPYIGSALLAENDWLEWKKTLWSESILQLPGLAASLQIIYVRNPIVFDAIMTITACVLFVILVAWARIDGQRLFGVTVIVLMASLVNFSYAYNFFASGFM